MKRAMLVILAILAGCEDREKMCKAIAETRLSALQPRDRIYWDENCVPKPAATEQGPVKGSQQEEAEERERSEREAKVQMRLAQAAKPFADTVMALRIGTNDVDLRNMVKPLGKYTLEKDKQSKMYFWQVGVDGAGWCKTRLVVEKDALVSGVVRCERSNGSASFIAASVEARP